MESKADFEKWYAKANPWGFDHSVNDKVRQSILLDFIKHARFQRGLDIGCGEGVFTREITRFVDHR